jgi:hypothetical protein
MLGEALVCGLLADPERVSDIRPGRAPSAGGNRRVVGGGGPAQRLDPRRQLQRGERIGGGQCLQPRPQARQVVALFRSVSACRAMPSRHR